ncbi:PREDICTED: probable tRNA N6-adenosine threonylcarbamoyltransferase, mitochondrial isoform X2 [Nicotiana attenuata]|uniref:probable tRNA N6-adenosine threonylcarbamoyltransferase, mitochondrial isoform X2 n=1 Tax=Nicotiana attenuata TaxID=49451 RepID=UPI0009056E47|nr:PREDICTED: probable tRNA N6-adenosine threonylcarbamoyltransferase, mitochondrial isoform X2 [Nicotiana attenuata]
MASLLPSLSSPISRLSFLLYRPSLHLTIKATNKLQFHNKSVKKNQSFKFFPAHCFSNSAANLQMVQTQKQKLGENENLVVLGIETSCDDTAAAVVNSNGEILSQVISSQNCLLDMEELLLRWQRKHMHW